jgi:hypothetical protein
MAAGLETKEKWESQLTQMKAAGMWDDSLNISYEEMKKAVSEGRPKVASQEFNVVIEAGEQDRVLQHLTGRKWQMLVAKEGSGGFVTTHRSIANIRACAAELEDFVAYTFALKFIASSWRASRIFPVTRYNLDSSLDRNSKSRYIA